jgi:hypothetical protein
MAPKKVQHAEFISEGFEFPPVNVESTVTHSQIELPPGLSGLPIEPPTDPAVLEWDRIAREKAEREAREDDGCVPIKIPGDGYLDIWVNGIRAHHYLRGVEIRVTPEEVECIQQCL